MSDTERFVDVDENPIPPRNTWEQLSVNQMIDIRNRLADRIYTFHNVPIIKTTLTQAIAHLDVLIIGNGDR